MAGSGSRVVRDVVGMALAGGLPALAGIPVFGLLVALGWGPNLANLVVLGVSAVFTYAVTQWLVYRYRRPDPRRSSVRFVLASAGTVAVFDVGVVAVVALLTADPLLLTLAKLVATGSGFVARTVVYRMWVFLPSGPRR